MSDRNELCKTNLFLTTFSFILLPHRSDVCSGYILFNLEWILRGLGRVHLQCLRRLYLLKHESSASVSFSLCLHDQLLISKCYYISFRLCVGFFLLYSRDDPWVL